MNSLKANQELRGLIYGVCGMMIFSITLPATRMALMEFDPIFVALGRSVVAAILSLFLLIATRQPVPNWRFLPSFLIMIIGGIVGFPLLSTLAMRDASASHGSVIVGLLPLATAFFGVWRAGERPSPNFWVFAIAGTILVVSFALLSSKGTLQLSDLALLGAVATASFGYAEGTILARTFGSWQVVCWALVFSSPALLPIVLQHLPQVIPSFSSSAGLGFWYVSFFSMFLGFVAWYRGLFLGGIARVGQLQLFQPFLTILASALLLGESVTFSNFGFAVGVIVCVALGRRRVATE
ncbi:DMT family transporter [Pseudanabaena biceps]|nr:DMT family transporter [Pseudanabaena biceps]